MQVGMGTLEGQDGSQAMIDDKTAQRDEMLREVKVLSYKMGSSPKSGIIPEPL
jgi:hypothetical protein